MAEGHVKERGVPLASLSSHRSRKREKTDPNKASRYLAGYGYCSRCERWTPLSKALRRRELLCPRCHRPLRLKPRCSRSRRKPVWRALRLHAKRGERA